MVVSGQLGSDERRNVGVDCRRFDANREPMGALSESDAVVLSTALRVDRDAEGKIAWFGQDNLRSIKLLVNDGLMREVLFGCPAEIRQKSSKEIKSL